MNTKAKGSGAEREIIHLFWQNSWAAIRVAGSGSMKYPSPDVLASNNKRKIAIECKTSKNEYQYLTKKEIKELIEFCRMFGAEPWVGVKLKSEWFFLNVEDLNETDKNFVVTKEIAKIKGLTFSEMTGNF